VFPFLAQSFSSPWGRTTGAGHGIRFREKWLLGRTSFLQAARGGLSRRGKVLAAVGSLALVGFLLGIANVWS